MPSLSFCRSALARSAWTRGIGLLLAWMIVAAGLPRWEVHAHDDAVHCHDHCAVIVEQDQQTELAHSDEGAAAPHLHLHDVTTASATLPVLLRIDVHAMAPSRWTRSFHSIPAPSAAGPPPQRPPIV